MFSNKLKRPALALAVTAGLLAVAGPASAEVVTNNNDPEHAARQVPKSSARPLLTDVAENNINMQVVASSAVPELDANANAFRPEVDDEVLAWIVYTHPEVA